MKIPEKFLWLIIILLVLILFIFGFHQRKYSPKNNTFWIEGKGLFFGSSSFVYTLDNTGEKEVENFILTFNITLEKQEQPYFARMLTFAPLEDPYRQFLVAQWDHSLVIMNGTDYGNNRKEPKIYLPLGIEGKPVNITIQASPEGTDVYIDKIFFRRYESLNFTIPAESILILGDHRNRSTGWIGTYHSLSLYLGSEKGIWSSYDFTEFHGTIIPDTSGNHHSLQNPDKKPQLILHPLGIPEISRRYLKRNWIDLFLNWFGFIPFTFLLSIALRRRNISNWIIGVLTISAAFGLSLVIEIYQIWIPTRDSSLLDLVLNTTGGITGFFFTFSIPGASKQQRTAFWEP